VEGDRVYVAGGDNSLGDGNTRIAVYSLLVGVETEASSDSTAPAPVVEEASTNATSAAQTAPGESGSPPSLPLGAFIDTAPVEVTLDFATRSPLQVVATWLAMAALALLVAYTLLRN